MMRHHNRGELRVFHLHGISRFGILQSMWVTQMSCQEFLRIDWGGLGCFEHYAVSMLAISGPG